MKKKISVMLAAVLVVMSAFINPLKAQDHKKEMVMLAKNYENSYNKKDAKTLKNYYTKDAVSSNSDGTSDTCRDAIETRLAGYFKNADVKVKIIVVKCMPESDGSVTVTGTYHLKGKSKAGEKIDVTGNYTNTSVKENGHWKISKSVLTQNK
jgi:uncharacterized protein (TIGR02246 family)